jgi:hypothetical protein
VLDRTGDACSLANLLRVRSLGVCTNGSRSGTASLFDNLDDTLTVERLQVFSEAMRTIRYLEPLLFTCSIA